MYAYEPTGWVATTLELMLRDKESMLRGQKGSRSPMDFEDTPEEAAFRAEARLFLEEHAAPKHEHTRAFKELSDAFSAEEMEHVHKATRWQATLYDNGWAGITWPKKYGGRGGTVVQQAIFNQEQSRFDVEVGVFAQGIGMAGPTIIAHGIDQQKERFLRPMLRGDELWCQLFSEPGAGSDLSALSTRAEQDGDDLVVNGQKVWTSSAHYSDWGILLVRSNLDVPKHEGITYLLVDMSSPGIDVRPLRQITGVAHFNEVFFTDVRVPLANVVGTVNHGWGVAITTLGNERSLIGTVAGDPWPSLLWLADVTGNTKDTMFRQALAKTYGDLQILKYLGWRSLSALSRDQPPGPETSVIKLARSQHLAQLGDLVMALQGAGGMVLDRSTEDIAQFGLQFLGQWNSRIGGGTDQVQRNTLAERVLGLPREARPDKAIPFRDLPT
jgi:alkylation response protein AidB-like acyl-CoA dehydrogenase